MAARPPGRPCRARSTHPPASQPRPTPAGPPHHHAPPAAPTSAGSRSHGTRPRCRGRNWSTPPGQARGRPHAVDPRSEAGRGRPGPRPPTPPEYARPGAGTAAATATRAASPCPTPHCAGPWSSPARTRRPVQPTTVAAHAPAVQATRSRTSERSAGNASPCPRPSRAHPPEIGDTRPATPPPVSSRPPRQAAGQSPTGADTPAAGPAPARPNPDTGSPTHPHELLRDLAGQLCRGQATGGQPATQIRQPVHVVNDRVHGEPLTGQILTQPVGERRQRPLHHDPSVPSHNPTRVHGLLLSVDGPIDRHEKPQRTTAA